jgi:hypothetical protein
MSAISRAPWRPVAAGCTRPYSSPCDGAAIAPTSSAATAWMRYPPAREPRPCPCARGSARCPPFRVRLRCLVQRAGGAAPFGRRADCFGGRGDAARSRGIQLSLGGMAVAPMEASASVARLDLANMESAGQHATGDGARARGRRGRPAVCRARDRATAHGVGWLPADAPLPARIDAARRRSGICRRSFESAAGVSVRRGAREWTGAAITARCVWRERRPVSAISSQVYCGVTRPAAAAGAPVGAAP